jgi:hypothetical protein
MSNAGSTPSTPPSGASVAPMAASSYGASSPTDKMKEIKLISHSPLFYWWPVWLMCFVFAFITFIGDGHLAILPGKARVEVVEADKGEYKFTFADKNGKKIESKVLDEAVKRSKPESYEDPFPTKISENPALGVLFCVLLVITIMVTNIPLRGLWSFVVLLGFALVAVIISLIPDLWNTIFKSIQILKIHINMAGYLTMGTMVFLAWFVSTFFFDRRAYILFTQGQIKLCEHIGDSVEAFPTMGVTLSKQRDDLFRHWIFGGRFLGGKFGTGDLILKFSTGDRREIRFSNVRGLDYYLPRVEELIKPIA